LHARDAFHEVLQGLSLLIRRNKTPEIDNAVLDHDA
jgi:hypothetical protein